MTDPFSRDDKSITPRAFTDADGRARLTEHFAVSGQSNAFQRFGSFSPWGRWLEVSAADHRTRRISLTEVLGAFDDPTRTEACKVLLSRGQTHDNSFDDVAGVYSADNGFFDCLFMIESDGASRGHGIHRDAAYIASEDMVT